jgi:DNA-binding MarR family transcriptional regulator
MTRGRDAPPPAAGTRGGMNLDPTILLLVGFLAGAGFVLLLSFLWTRIPRSPARWQPAAQAAGPGRTVGVVRSGLSAVGADLAPVGPMATEPTHSSPSVADHPPGPRGPTGPSPAVAVAGVADAGEPRTEPPDTVARPGPGRRTGAYDPATLRLSQRVVLHLQRQPRITRFDLAPLAMTQAGMSESLDATQSALAKVLHRLAAAGVLEERREHVAGEPRRLKVYQLTPTGEALARDVRGRLPRTSLSPTESAVPSRRS